MISINKGSSFQKDTFILSIGTIIAQAIPVLSMLVFSRYYGDASLGTFNLFFQIVSVLSTVANGRLEQAYFVMKNPKDARNIFFTALTFNVIFSVIILTVSIFFFKFSNYNAEGYDILNYTFLIPICIFLGGIILATNFYLNFKGKFLLFSRLRILQAFIANLIPMLFLLFYYKDSTGLIIGFVIGQLAILTGFWLTLNKTQYTAFQFPKRNVILATLSKFKALPSVNSPLILIDQLGASLPIIFIYSYYSDSIAGQYSLASKLLLLPAVVVGSAMGQVFYKNLSDLRKAPTEAVLLFKEVLRKLVFFSLLFFTGTFLFSKIVFPILFGQGWEVAGFVASYLSIAMVFKFVVSPLSSVLLVFERYRSLGFWQFGNFIIQVIVIIIAGFFKLEFISYLWLLIIVDLISYLIYFYIILKVIRNLK
jgi:O-antigen/teichoic acid export membrane protein